MSEITIAQHLQLRAEDPGHEEALVRAVYDELRRMASHHLRGEPDQHTLQTTALVHEAYLKLVPLDRITERSRSYFFSAASRAMRQVLVEAARRRRSFKRGAGERPLPLDGLDLGSGMSSQSDEEIVLWIHALLDRFAEEYPRQARVVECRFFGGLSIAETAQVLEVSERSVKRDWTFAQAWLYKEWN